MERNERATGLDRVKSLTWEDLEEWAGGKTVSRGRHYQEQGVVRDPALTTDGGIVAWVLGSHRYATRVDWIESGLESRCTCPVGYRCKHAVAVILDYLEHLRKGKEPPPVTARDERLEQFSATAEEEMWEDEDQEDAHRVAEVGEVPSALAQYLEGLTKSQIMELVVDLATRHSVVRETIRDRLMIAKGDVARLVAAVQRDISDLSAEPDWSDSWSEESDTPDYSRVRERLEALLAQGHADEALQLGEELLRAGTEQVERSNDEGETAEEIGSCMAVVFEALPRSSLSPTERILWAIDAVLSDEFDLCDGIRPFLAQEHDPSLWSAVADVLLDRLGRMKPGKRNDPHSQSYQRDRLSDWVIQALEHAGRHEEVIPLCEREAEVTMSYVRLVRHLKDARKWDEALRWIEKGIAATEKELPGIVQQLRDEQRRIFEARGDWSAVLALRCTEFLERPSAGSFKKLQAAAEKTEQWHTVRTAALAYLQSGRPPAPSPPWPPAKPPRSGKPPRGLERTFPDEDTLLEIALTEGNPDEVLRWYRSLHAQSPYRALARSNQVADILAGPYPEEALTIWKNLAEGHIAQTKPNDYVVAVRYLRKMRERLLESGKEGEWTRYLASLRQTHARKRRFVELLDGLKGGTILHP